MRQYFQKMSPIGRELSEKEKEQAKANARDIARVEEEVATALAERKNTGLPAEKLHKRGEKTAWERIEILVIQGLSFPSTASMILNSTRKGAPVLSRGWERYPENTP